MKKLLLVLALIGLGLVAAAYYVSPSSNTHGDEGFTYASVERGELVETISATGNVQPREIVNVGSELSGKVVKIYPQADFNQEVKEGDPLLELDNCLADLTLAQARQAEQKANSLVTAAEIKRDAAKIALELKKELLTKEVGSRREVDQYELQLRGAEEDLKAAHETVKEAEIMVQKAEYGLKLCTVRSPASGVILERKVVLGQLVAPPASVQLFTIATDLGRMRLHAQVAEGDISKVRKGLKSRFTVYAYADASTPFEGNVEQIHLTSGSSNGLQGAGGMPSLAAAAGAQGAVFYDAIIDAPNRHDPDSMNGTEWMLRPGMTANVDIIRRTHKDAWKVPAAALNFQLDEHFQTEPAKNKLKEWQARSDHDEWQPVWIMAPNKKPWPIFVRTGGMNKSGEPEAITDGQFKEVLGWDPDLQTQPDPKDPSTFPKVIVAAPPAKKSGLFDQVKLKF